MFPTYFRKTISHLDRSVFSGSKTFMGETDWKSISLVSVTLSLCQAQSSDPNSLYADCSATIIALKLFGSADSLELDCGSVAKALCFIISPLSGPFILHLKLMWALRPLEFVSNSITINHQCKYNCIFQIGASIK
jgi:hypothetical protein